MTALGGNAVGPVLGVELKIPDIDSDQNQLSILKMM